MCDVCAHVRACFGASVRVCMRAFVKCTLYFTVTDSDKTFEFRDLLTKLHVTAILATNYQTY